MQLSFSLPSSSELDAFRETARLLATKGQAGELSGATEPDQRMALIWGLWDTCLIPKRKAFSWRPGSFLALTVRPGRWAFAERQGRTGLDGGWGWGGLKT